MRWTSMLAAALVLPVAALAHDGHGTGDVLVQVAEARLSGQSVAVSALLTNLSDEPVSLTGIGSGSAAVQSRSLPVTIPADTTLTLTADLVFEQAVPGILTLDFSFGDEGSGPVLIIPEAEETTHD